MDPFSNQDPWDNTEMTAQNYYTSGEGDFDWNDLENIPFSATFDNETWNNTHQALPHDEPRDQGIEDMIDNLPYTAPVFYRNDEYSDISLSPPTIQHYEETDRNLPPKKRRRVHETDFSTECAPYINLNPQFPEDVVTSHIPNQDFIRYCTVRPVIVGMGNFRGEVEAGEEVFLIKDGSSKTSLVITNKYGIEVGYLKSDVATVLSPLRDRKVIGIEGTAVHGSKNALLNSIGVDLNIFGKEDHKISTLKKIIDIGVPVKVDIGPSDSKEEISKILGCEEKSDVYFDENHFLNMKEEADTVNTIFENLTEDDKQTPAEPSKEIITPLHVHQKQALHWMMMKEKGDQLPPFWELKADVYHNNITYQKQTTKPRSIKGGILADEMGLGKTLTVISLIVTNPKKSTHPLDKVSESRKNGKEDIEAVEQKDEHQHSDTERQTQYTNASSDTEEPSEEEDVQSDHEVRAQDEVTDCKSEEHSEGGDVCSESEDQGKNSNFCSASKEQDKNSDLNSNLDELSNDTDVFSDTGKRKRNEEVSPNTEDVTDDDHSSLQNDESSVLEPVKSQEKAKYTHQTGDLEEVEMKATNDAEKLLKRKKRKKRKKSSKTTLIVAPLSVINVWQTQITQHVDPMHPLRVSTFHGRNRSEVSVLTENDIVITSYDTLRIDAKTQRTLQQVKWFRVVLDEGHKIKNPSSKQTQAINSLHSERRWILTGTPIQNKIEELWSLTSFLKIDTFTDINQWKKIIVDPLVYGDGDAKTRVFHLVNFIALRRTKTSTINGEKIISLPTKRIYERVLVFSDKEREIYGEFDRGCKQLIRRLIDERRHLQEIGIFYAALVRLRQLCCHPEIIPRKAKVGKVKLARSLTDFDSTQSSVEKLASLLRLSENDCCSICLEEICVKEGMKAPVITDCDHVFCKVCILEVIQQHGACPNCRGGLTMNSITECPPEQLALRLGRPELDKSVFSTKTTALMNDLLHLRENCPDVKSVIVSEFTTLLDVIEEPLKNSNFRFVRLDGKMTQKARAKSIKVFSSSEADSPTVMLLSLKAGGEGISLIAASHMFLLTPHWNPSTEDQCFDRCHRIGQTKDVTVIKYVVKDTIEERILSLQKQKKKLMECAFNNNKEKPEKLGIDEIMTLLNIPCYGE
ncbi:helicase-like transcription factor [Ostrea edulis]|uniref:helicase-like transcription factor n=1 Tax=Ostrea edulis TaxID=37623 RepID=UPI0024AEF22D|nr:helicase-like transcription factor [Ostrea edulis]XP_048732692.2 helicase-like transcription factor [Ostrea edulis]XP_056021457.1 helicase-like transcription factor [Ostrea edulis]